MAKRLANWIFVVVGEVTIAEKSTFIKVHQKFDNPKIVNEIIGMYKTNFNITYQISNQNFLFKSFNKIFFFRKVEKSIVPKF